MDRVSRSVRAVWVAGLVSLSLVVGAPPVGGASAAGSRRHVCRRPARARVLASNRKAVLFSRGGDRFYGCLKALGVTRLLLDARDSYFSALLAVRLAGRFAALEPRYASQYGNSEDATVYDLSSGKATDLAQVREGPTVTGLDFLALDSSGFAAWRETSSPHPQGLRSMSCPSASLCVAGDDAGNILTSNDPAGGPDAWSIAGADQGQTIVDQGQEIMVSCASVSMCVAADFAGNILVSTDPTGGQSAWSETKIDQGGFLASVSCASVTLCVAVGGGTASRSRAMIFTSRDPGGGTSAWSSARVASRGETALAVSCPSASLCVAATNFGDVVTSTDPTGGASVWKTTPVDQGNALEAVSCPSVWMCVAVDENGNILTTTDPTGDARAWRKAQPFGIFLIAVSCPSVSMCVAVGYGNGTDDILTSTHATGGKRAWTIALADPASALRAVSCPSVSMCVAGDGSGDILTSTDPTGGANAWSSATVDIPGCPPLLTPCTSERLYAHDDQGTRVVDTAPPGRGNSIGNVALAARVLNWTHDGAQRQLQLR